MSVGLVVVSHSAALADAAITLSREMLGGRDLTLLAAAGVEDGSTGTDAAGICAAMEAADSGDGVVVLMDLGSAVLSAEMALEFLDDEARARVVLCPAPLVEGLVVAVTVAAAGGDRATVAAEAAAALQPKIAQLPGFGGTGARADGDGRGAGGGEAGGGHAGGGHAGGGHAGGGHAGGVAGGHAAGGAAGEARASFEVGLAHGLHARPVARLVSALSGLDARVSARNATTGSGWVDARSVTAVAGLGVRQGHEVEVRADGRQAQAAVEAVLAEADDGFGETVAAAGVAIPDGATAGAVIADGVTAGGDDAAPTAAVTRISYAQAVGMEVTALPISPGIAVGPARVDASAGTPAQTPGAGEDVERQRLQLAVGAAAEQLAAAHTQALSELGPQEADIFTAQAQMVQDPMLHQRAHGRLRQGVTAERAWWEATAEVAEQLAALPDAYQRARAEDVRAVAGLVITALSWEQRRGDAAAAPGDSGVHGGADGHRSREAAQQPESRVGRPAVLVTDELSAGRAATLRREETAGVVLTRGSATSHAAILLRARGVPAVLAGSAAVASLTGSGVSGPAEIALDGTTGELLIEASAGQLEEFRMRAAEDERRRRGAGARSGEPAVTSDGVEVLVGANVGSAGDAAAALDAGADLAGLVRTEFLFLDRATPPTVDDQVSAYRELAAGLGGRRLTLRTLDIGGDKPVPYLAPGAEANPFLGMRGLRLSLTHPALLRDQLTAIVTVAHEAPVSVMFPMVATLAELAAAGRALDDAVAAVGRGRPDDLQVGVMVEIPALALKAAAVAPHVQFLSIGTNDLTQYALASDRGNEELAVLADPLDPGVLRLIAAVCHHADEVLVAVCGELAADPDAVEVLIGLGVRELSVSPAAVALTKQRVRGVDVARARRLAQRALECAGALDVRAEVRRSGSAAEVSAAEG